MLRSEREHLQGGTTTPEARGTKGRGWSYRTWKLRQGLCEVGTQTLQKRPCADGAGKQPPLLGWGAITRLMPSGAAGLPGTAPYFQECS